MKIVQRPAAPIERAGPARLGLAWATVTVAVAATLFTPARLPFYDYPEWVLQGRILRGLLTGAPGMTALYRLVPAPVPNMAAPAVIAVLGLALPDEAAGRVLLVGGVLGFAAGYAFLVRRLQGRPTALELTGPLWATGYFLDRGYLSYLFALPVAFAGIGVLHPALRSRPSRGRLAGLAALGAVAFLAHLIAWGVLLLAIAAAAVALVRQGRRADAGRLVATTAPSALLLIWYVATGRSGGHLTLYGSLRDKLLALAEPLELFARMDPYAGVVPPFPAQVLVGVVLIAVLAAALRRADVAAALRGPVAVTALVLGVLAALDPVGNIDSLTKPDQRLLFPAVLLLLAALPWRQLEPRQAGITTSVTLTAILLHLATLVSIQPPLQRLTDALGPIPPDAEVATLALPADGGCSPQLGPTIGITALKWVDVERRLRLGAPRVNLQETSVVRLRFDPTQHAGLTALTPAPAQATAAVHTGPPAAWVEVIGCDPDVARVTAGLGPDWQPVSTGQGFSVLRHAP
jgi:hypothetical protein